MNSQIALEKKVEINRDLLIAALNKNQVSFAQIAKSAESISSGSLKLKLDSGGKVFVFEYLDKKVVLELNGLRLKGLKYLNDILIDDILTKGELDEVYRILEQVQEELLNKADKEHTHEISDVNGLQDELNNKADKEHTHEISDINGLQDELDSKMNIGSSEFNDIIVNDKIEIPNQQKPDLFPYITDVKITGSLTTTTTDVDKRGITISFLEAKVDTYVGEEETIFRVRDENSTFQIDIDCGTYDPNKSYPVKGTNVPSNITYPSTFVNKNFSLHIDFSAEESKETKIFYILGRHLGLGGAFASSHNYITISFDYDSDAISLINNEVPTKKFIVDWLYPIGSIYLSMNNVDPSKIFGGTWTQIKDYFLLCSRNESKVKGGSAYITEKQLPSHIHKITNIRTEYAGQHTHTYAVSDDRNGFPDGSADTSGGTSARESYWRGNKNLSNNRTSSSSGNHRHAIYGETDSTGSGVAYWQPHMTCYGWYRTA